MFVCNVFDGIFAFVDTGFANENPAGALVTGADCTVLTVLVVGSVKLILFDSV